MRQTGHAYETFSRLKKTLSDHRISKGHVSTTRIAAGGSQHYTHDTGSPERVKTVFTSLGLIFLLESKNCTIGLTGSAMGWHKQ